MGTNSSAFINIHCQTWKTYCLRTLAGSLHEVLQMFTSLGRILGSWDPCHF